MNYVRLDALGLGTQTTVMVQPIDESKLVDLLSSVKI